MSPKLIVSHLILTAALLMAGAVQLCAQQFQGKLVYTYNDARLAAKGEYTWILGQGFLVLRQQQNGGEMSYVMETGKQEFVWVLGKDAYSVPAKLSAKNVASADDLHMTSETRQIAGYNCVKFEASYNGGKCEIWATQALKYPFQTFPALTYKNAETGLLAGKGLDLTPVEIKTWDKDGKLLFEYVLKSAVQSPVSLTDNPATKLEVKDIKEFKFQ